MAEHTTGLAFPELRDVLMQEPDTGEPDTGEPDTGGVPLVQALALELEFIHSLDHPIPEGTCRWPAELHRERLAELIESNIFASSIATVKIGTYRGCENLRFTLKVDDLEYGVLIKPKLTSPGFTVEAGRWGEPDEKKLRLIETMFLRFLLRRVAYVPRNYEIVTSEVMLKEGAP